MGKDWTDDEVQKEIADAVAIVREDRFSKWLKETLGSGGKPPANGPGGNPPPPGPDSDPPKPKKSLWWGDVEE